MIVFVRVDFRFAKLKARLRSGPYIIRESNVYNRGPVKKKTNGKRRLCREVLLVFLKGPVGTRCSSTRCIVHLVDSTYVY